MQSKIIVVEDCIDVQALMKMQFKSLTDYEVEICSSSSDALKMIDSGFSPEMLITDWWLDDGNASNLIKELRLKIPGLKIGVVSGESSLNEEALDIDFLMIKPVSFFDLKQKIADVLATVTESPSSIGSVLSSKSSPVIVPYD